MDPQEAGYIWYDTGGVCELMKSCRCRGQACGFRKSESQSRQAAQRWRLRMASLSEEQQKQIAKKYYGGNMPWK